MLPHEKRVVRFLAGHLAAGLGAACVFAGALFAADVAGIWTLIAASPDGWLFAGLLLFGLCVTFGSLAMGVAIMLERDPGNGTGTPPGGRPRRLLRRSGPAAARSPDSRSGMRPAFAGAGRSKGRSRRNP